MQKQWHPHYDENIRSGLDYRYNENARTCSNTFSSGTHNSSVEYPKWRCMREMPPPNSSSFYCWAQDWEKDEAEKGDAE